MKSIFIGLKSDKLVLLLGRLCWQLGRLLAVAEPPLLSLRFLSFEHMSALPKCPHLREETMSFPFGETP